MSIPEPLRTATIASHTALVLRAAVIELRGAGHAEAEDPILDTLDAVVGCCQPSARLFPEPTS